MPTVAMKVPERKAPSLNWMRKQVFPTPESPSSITYNMGCKSPLIVQGTAGTFGGSWEVDGKEEE